MTGSRPPGRSWKVEGIRRAHEDAHPVLAAERAAERFERDAIVIPGSLHGDSEPGAASWKVTLWTDVRSAYCDVVIAGADGATLDMVLGGFGEKRRRDAISALRKSGAVHVAMERRPDSRGRLVERVVLTAPEQRGRS